MSGDPMKHHVDCDYRNSVLAREAEETFGLPERTDVYDCNLGCGDDLGDRDGNTRYRGVGGYRVFLRDTDEGLGQMNIGMDPIYRPKRGEDLLVRMFNDRGELEHWLAMVSQPYCGSYVSNVMRDGHSAADAVALVYRIEAVES